MDVLESTVTDLERTILDLEKIIDELERASSDLEDRVSKLEGVVFSHKTSQAYVSKVGAVTLPGFVQEFLGLVNGGSVVFIQDAGGVKLFTDDQFLLLMEGRSIKSRSDDKSQRS